MFSDSQLRPLCQKQLDFDPGWMINSTPGGGYRHINSEISECQHSAPNVLIFLGTNDLGSGLTKATEEFKALLQTATSKFSNSKVNSMIFFIFNFSSIMKIQSCCLGKKFNQNHGNSVNLQYNK